MPSIEHFAIYAADPHALKDFYLEALGLRVLVDNRAATPPGYFLGDDRGGAIEIIGRPDGERGTNQRWVCHLAFRVDDYAAARAALERRGMAFEPDTAIDTPVFKTAFFNDPEGNRVQIAWREKPLGS